jgi:hypothetical protein
MWCQDAVEVVVVAGGICYIAEVVEVGEEFDCIVEVVVEVGEEFDCIAEVVVEIWHWVDVAFGRVEVLAYTLAGEGCRWWYCSSASLTRSLLMYCLRASMH